MPDNPSVPNEHFRLWFADHSLRFARRRAFASCGSAADCGRHPQGPPTYLSDWEVEVRGGLLPPGLAGGGAQTDGLSAVDCGPTAGAQRPPRRLGWWLDGP
jgi:hypothetical protein